MDKDFERFWEEYPKKRSKGDAFKAWNQTASKRPPIAKILKALAVLRASEDWRKDGGQFIPYPASWIRAWGWDDVPEVQLQEVRRDGKVWWQTVSGIEDKAKELNMEWTGEYAGAAESFQQFSKRVKAASGSSNVIPMDEKPRPHMRGVQAKAVAGE